MQTEIEVKFLYQDHNTIRSRLTSLGAFRVSPMILMRRTIIDYPDRRLQTGTINAYIRVRDEGTTITLTYKQFDALSIDGASEVSVVVNSFEDTVQVFTSIGLEVVSLQESKRETWQYKNCEIVLDEWPWLSPYLEIEGESEDALRTVAVELGLTWENAVFGDVMVAYRADYPYLTPEQTIGKIPEVRFNTPFPNSLKDRRAQ